MLDFTDLFTVLVAIVVILAIWLYKTTLFPSNFPPGPKPVPIFGNMLQLRKDNVLSIHATYDRLSKIYGPIFGLKMGSVNSVVLADLEVIHEALVKNAEAFTRPYSLPVPTHSFSKNGRPTSLWTFGHSPLKWTKLSRLKTDPAVMVQGLLVKIAASKLFPIFKPPYDCCLFNVLVEHYLLEKGHPKQSVENKIQEEVESFCEELLKLTNKPVSLNNLNKIAVHNILYSNVYGSRLDYKDNKLSKYIQKIDKYLTNKTYGSIVNYIPAFYYLNLGKKLFEDITKNLNALDNFLDDEMKKHKEDFDSEAHNDFIDFYLSESAKDWALDEDSFRRYLLDMQSGNAGVFSTLEWLWLLVSIYPNIQKRCKKEIDDFLGKFGKDRKLELSDQDDLPYVHATVLETFRIANPAPVSILYETVKDVTIADYHIPKHTVVTCNLFSVHRSKKYWDSPNEFKPERWLDQDGMLNKSKMNENQGFVPFGVGRRQCAGKYLALGEVFLFFATVMRKFEINLSEPDNPPSLEGYFDLVMKTQPHELIITSR